MHSVLMLAHRMPYPPTKGDKIRSYNILKYLSARCDVHLGAFVDDPGDWQYEPRVRELCQDVRLIGIRPGMRKAKSLVGFLTGEPLTLPYYRHRAMEQWVRSKLECENISRVLTFSSSMAQYALSSSYRSVRKTADFVDVDSEKWRQYAKQQRAPMDWLYAREGGKLLGFERRVAANFDHCVFVSEAEASLFRQRAPESARNTIAIQNGVDTAFFSPKREYVNPYHRDELALVFTGAMDYWANVDAVSWFAKEIFPRIRESVPLASFHIVGARPTREVKRLGELDSVNVTGSVEDVRPYIAHAAAAVAPLRIARGVQNKVLEAMAMAKPVLATTGAMAGIDAVEALQQLVSNNEDVLVSRSVELLTQGDRCGYGETGREFVVRKYAWNASLAKLEKLLALDMGDIPFTPLGISPRSQTLLNQA